jgi:hypothetical protein
MSGERDYSKKVCGLCVEVYEACADECVRNTPIQIIVDNVSRYVSNVQKNVVGFQVN